MSPTAKAMGHPSTRNPRGEQDWGTPSLAGKLLVAPVRPCVTGHWTVPWSIGLDLGAYAYPDHEPMAFWGNRKKLDQFLELEECGIDPIP